MILKYGDRDLLEQEIGQGPAEWLRLYGYFGGRAKRSGDSLYEVVLERRTYFLQNSDLSSYLEVTKKAIGDFFFLDRDRHLGWATKAAFGDDSRWVTTIEFVNLGAFVLVYAALVFAVARALVKGPSSLMSLQVSLFALTCSIIASVSVFMRPGHGRHISFLIPLLIVFVALVAASEREKLDGRERLATGALFACTVGAPLVAFAAGVMAVT